MANERMLNNTLRTYSNKLSEKIQALSNNIKMQLLQDTGHATFI